MPNIVTVSVGPSAGEAGQVDAALARCEGEYIAIVPSGFPIREFWLEDSLYALINNSADGVGFELEDSTEGLWAVVLKRDDLRRARESFGNLSVRESLSAAGVAVRRVLPDEIPFQFDQLLSQANLAEKDGSWAKAARMFEHIAERYQNELWMKSRAAAAFFEAGELGKAAELNHEVNEKRPTVDTLLLEAKLNRRKKDFNPAIELLGKAEEILEGRELVWT